VEKAAISFLGLILDKLAVLLGDACGLRAVRVLGSGLSRSGSSVTFRLFAVSHSVTVAVSGTSLLGSSFVKFESNNLAVFISRAFLLSTRELGATLIILFNGVNHLARSHVSSGRACGLGAVSGVLRSFGLLALFFTTRVEKAAISFLGFVLDKLAVLLGNACGLRASRLRSGLFTSGHAFDIED